MNGNKTVILLTLGCLLVLSAIAAAPALANTAYKCESVGSGASFSDEHCLNASSGAGFTHTAISPNTSVAITGSNSKTVESTTAASTAKLKGVASGVETEIQCTTVGGGGGSMENKEEGATMWAQGGGEIIFTGCSVTKPAGKGCFVQGGEFKSKELLGSTKGLTNQLKIEPSSGTELASTTIEGCSVSGLNKTFPITGSLITDTSGATISSTHAGITAQGNFKWAGQKAGFEGAFTAEDSATGSGLVVT